jgi:hypothetical protein
MSKRWNKRERHNRESSRKGKQTAEAKRRRERKAVKEAAARAGHPQMARMKAAFINVLGLAA